MICNGTAYICFERLSYNNAVFDDGSKVTLPKWVTKITWQESGGMHNAWEGFRLHSGVCYKSGEFRGLEITGLLIHGYIRENIEDDWARLEKEIRDHAD